MRKIETVRSGLESIFNTCIF